MKTGLHSVGMYLPPVIRKNDWWSDDLIQSWQAKPPPAMRKPPEGEPPPTPGMVKALGAMAALAKDPFKGALERRVMAEGMVTSDMEAEAAKDAIARAGIAADQIDLILTNSQLPDYLSVPGAPEVHRKAGLRRSCLAITTDNACNSFLAQLTLAEAMIASGQARYALLVQSSGGQHLCRREHQHSAWFGDAATAVVVGPVAEGKGVLGRANRTDGDFYRALVTGTPGTQWHQGGQPVVYIEDPKMAWRMLATIPDMGKEVLDAAMAEAGVDATAIQFFGSHQGTSWFRRVAQEHCGLTNAKFVDTFGWTGSLAAANIPFCLGVGEREGLLRSGDLVAMYSGGSGITYSGAVLRWGRD